MGTFTSPLRCPELHPILIVHEKQKIVHPPQLLPGGRVGQNKGEAQQILALPSQTHPDEMRGETYIATHKDLCTSIDEAYIATHVKHN